MMAVAEQKNFLSFIYYLLIFLDNTLVLRHPLPIDYDDDDEGRWENKRCDEENAQETSYNVSWACGMFFFFYFFISFLYLLLTDQPQPPRTTTTTNGHLNASKPPSRWGKQGQRGGRQRRAPGMLFQYIYIIITLLTITTRLRRQRWCQHHHYKTITSRLKHTWKGLKRR